MQRPLTGAASSKCDYSAVILGAGMSGICAAIELQNAGIDDFIIIEKQDGIGGTWWDNRYPGAQVDVPAPVYAFSFASNPDWRQRFADAGEIQRYLQRLAQQHGLQSKLRLGTRLISAQFDESSGRWQFRTDAGDAFAARFFVCSTGPLSQPRWPAIAGLETFKGTRIHSARWEDGYSFAGKRVAVIGTGSTAVQLIPPIAREAAQLFVFQRSANWVLPRLDRRYRWLDRWLMRVPGYAGLVRRSWSLFLETMRRGFDDGTLARAALHALARWQRRRQVRSPTLRQRLTPDYPLGCKRLIFSNSYFPAMSAEQVELVTASISRISEHAVVTTDGVEHSVDVLVCATGFDTVHLLSSISIVGRGGQTLAAAWSAGPEAMNGISVTGFPNLFLMLGPNTATGHTSTLFFIEPEVRHAIACMRRVLDGGHRSIEVSAEAQQHYNSDLQSRLGGSVWSRCSSWYRTDEGRIVALFPGPTDEYVRSTEQPDWSAYRIE